MRINQIKKNESLQTDSNETHPFSLNRTKSKVESRHRSSVFAGSLCNKLLKIPQMMSFYSFFIAWCQSLFPSYFSIDWRNGFSMGNFFLFRVEHFVWLFVFLRPRIVSGPAQSGDESDELPVRVHRQQPNRRRDRHRRLAQRIRPPHQRYRGWTRSHGTLLEKLFRHDERNSLLIFLGERVSLLFFLFLNRGRYFLLMFSLQFVFTEFFIQ